MYNTNAKRLWEMARKRRAQAAKVEIIPVANTNPFYSTPCVQCGQPAITKFTDMVSGETSYWCDEDYDHWWMIKTYVSQIRSGEIETIGNLLIPNADYIESQLVGWPD